MGSALCVNFFVGTHTPLFWGIRFGEHLVCQLFVGPHFPYFWGARLGEYLVCQLFVGPLIPLFLRCQVRGVHGLPTFCWTSYSPIFEVPVLGSTWLDLISPLFEEPGFCWNSFHLFLRCQVWGIPGLLTFRWTSYFPIKSNRGSLDICWISSDLLYIYIYPNKPYLNMGILLFGAHEYALVSRFLSIQVCWYCRFIISIWLDVVLRCSRHVWHH